MPSFRPIRLQRHGDSIAWPIPADATPELSAKDKVQPPLADFDSPFAYDDRPLEPLA